MDLNAIFLEKDWSFLLTVGTFSLELLILGYKIDLLPELL